MEVELSVYLVWYIRAIFLSTVLQMFGSKSPWTDAENTSRGLTMILKFPWDGGLTGIWYRWARMFSPGTFFQWSGRGTVGRGEGGGSTLLTNRLFSNPKHLLVPYCFSSSGKSSNQLMREQVQKSNFWTNQTEILTLFYVCLKASVQKTLIGHFFSTFSSLVLKT